MSSIGNSLNSINTALLGEISSFSTPKSTGSGTTIQSNAVSSTDRLDLSKAADLFRDLQKLQTDNPAEFKQVLTDAAVKLQAAAQQQTDPAQASFLSSLSDRFQKAASSGDLSALKPPASDDSYSAKGHHHHHHYGGTPPPPAPDTGTQEFISSILAPSQTSQTADKLSQALAVILGGTS